MNQISTFLLKTHVVLSTLWALLDSLSNSIIVEAKHITGDPAAAEVHSRVKRNSFQFGNMITCVTKHNSMDLFDYGCYCGLGGQGQPKDEIDWCCFDHDECWSKVVEDPECSGLSSPYVVTYDWGCSANTNSVHCYNDYEDNSCARRTCECDRIASECFARNEFHWEFYDLDPYFEHCNTTVDLSVRNPTTEAPNAKESSSAPSQHIVTSQWTMVAVAMAIMRLVTTSFTAETHWQSGV